MLLTSRLQSRGITRKPDGSRGTSSDTAASTGAKTSWAHAPTAFSSTPLQSYFSIQPQPKKIRDIQKNLSQTYKKKQYVLTNTLHLQGLSLRVSQDLMFWYGVSAHLRQFMILKWYHYPVLVK